MGPMARWLPTSASGSEDGGIGDTGRQSLCPRVRRTGKWAPPSQTLALGHCSLRELRSGAQRRETTKEGDHKLAQKRKAAWRRAP